MTDSTPFTDLIKHLGSRASDFSFDQPRDKDGVWWLDLVVDDRPTTVFWKAETGFGLFVSEETFGQRPDELHTDASKAAKRLLQIAERQASHEGGIMTLKELRLLLGQTQMSLANALGTGQAEISRLESRDDTHVDRFRSYVEALGGTLELRVTFPDFRSLITLPSPSASRSRRRADA